MKIEVTPSEAAAVYVGKAVSLLETACELVDHCGVCPLYNGPSAKCAKGVLKDTLIRNTD